MAGLRGGSAGRCWSASISGGLPFGQLRPGPTHVMGYALPLPRLTASLLARLPSVRSGSVQDGEDLVDDEVWLVDCDVMAAGHDHLAVLG